MTEETAQEAPESATETEQKHTGTELRPNEKPSAEVLLEVLAEEFLNDVPDKFKALIPEELSPKGKIDFIRNAQKMGIFEASKALAPNGQGAEAPTRTPQVDYDSMSTDELLTAGLSLN